MDRRVQHMELVEQLHNLLGELSERQQAALKLSYGLDGHPPLRQYEVGPVHAESSIHAAVQTSLTSLIKAHTKQAKSVPCQSKLDSQEAF